jgi:hypothetical protein
MRMDINDALLEFYRVNNDYHNTKENMVWLSASLYLGFSAALIAFQVSNPVAIKTNQQLLVPFSVILLVFAQVFVLMQNWYKAKSVFIYSRLMDLLRRFDQGMKRPKYWEIITANEPKIGTPGFQPVKIFLRNGATGIIGLVVMLLFGVVQIYLYCSV